MHLFRLQLLPTLLACAVLFGAALTGASRAVADDVPPVLSDADRNHYREIFRLQVIGDWRKADRHIKALADPVLMGHVLFQRYMHPTGWRSTYEQLHTWMKHYSDHPGAERVYKLGLKRRPASGWKPLTRPRIARLSGIDGIQPDTGASLAQKPSRTRRSTHDRRILRQVYHNVFRDRMTVTERMLAGREGRRMSAAALSEARAALTRGHLSKRRFDRALKQAGLAMRGEGGGKRVGAYYAGIVHWAEGRKGQALEMFRLASVTDADQMGEMEGSVDLWHARAALHHGYFDEARQALERAAQHPRSIYGLVARTRLALTGTFDWHQAVLTSAEMTQLLGNVPVKRAVALTEVGQFARADEELKRLSARVSRDDAAVLVALSAVIDAPATAYRLGRLRLRSHGERIDQALFPLPSWQVNDRVPVGRALLMAVARRESGFNAEARSRVGARGLMQLMPGTARFVAQMEGFRRPGRSGLNDPATSLKFGQAYLAHLRSEVEPKDSLIHILAAYNAGPGTLRKWRRKFGTEEDPLLFLELIGARETRHFVRDVLAAYWIYRGRLGLPAPSLEAMARGNWPTYVPPLQLAGHPLATGDAADAHR